MHEEGGAHQHLSAAVRRTQMEDYSSWISCPELVGIQPEDRRLLRWREQHRGKPAEELAEGLAEEQEGHP